MTLAIASSPLRVVAGGLSEPSRQQSDRALVQAVREGDATAAAAFHDRLRPIVDRTLCRLLGNRDQDYDDVAQQALVELVASIDRFRADCPLEVWAAVVAARAVYYHIRRRRVERWLFLVDGEQAADRVDCDPRSGIVLRASLRRIESHLQRIDPKKAWAFLLHDVHGYDLGEMGTIMSSSRAAAQSRLVRGRKELHRRIADDPELAFLLTESASPGETG
jgi:RNA polymerase sigma-70 factor (ECF subfamily)